MSKDKVPPFTKYMNPIMECLYSKGGSATLSEIYQCAAENLGLSEKVLSIQHSDKRRSEVQYRIAWALTYLKKADYINNSSRGVWSLVNKGKPTIIDEKNIRKEVREKIKAEKATEPKVVKGKQSSKSTATDYVEEDSWKTEALGIIQNISPDSFERLAQRMLRESGFVEVAVTGKTGDGGIDGHGILRFAGLVGFSVFFQCKRYKGSVTASQVRDFRGAMIGRADKGLFITTGTFTKDAQKEATRDGATVIDLIDGDLLVEKLKELNLGIKAEMVEKVVINQNWFDSI